MSLPPELIRVKRKASEIEPVSYLRVQEHKRHVTDAFVYQRQKQDSVFTDDSTSKHRRPIIHTSNTRRTETASDSSNDNNKDTATGREHDKGADAVSGKHESGALAQGPRHFHMSRPDMMGASNYPTRRNHPGISKKRSAPALFVERKSKRVPSKKFQSIAHGLSIDAPQTSHGDPTIQPHASALGDTESHVVDVKQRKKPGLARQAQMTGAEASKKELPTTMMNRWNVDLDQLAADMNAFTMEQIGLNLKRQEADDKRQKERAAAQRARLATQSSPSRFKPKAPAKRYAERHPELRSAAAADNDMANAGIENSDTDEDDYVIETYIRVPASTMSKKNVAANDVGLLVFDEEPDMEYFYGGNEDSDDDFVEDEEDENAENHYTADYPDDEVASDDEFGQNAYAYRTGNASDLEEYDIDNYQESSPDDELGLQGGFKSFVDRNGQLSRHL